MTPSRTTHRSLLTYSTPPAILNRNTETDTMQTPTTNPSKNILRGLAASALAVAGLLSGCGGALSSVAGSNGGPGSSTIQFTGNVHGGQQPVAGAIIQLYTVGTTGSKSASTPILTSAVTSDANGTFHLGGTFNCATLPATQVYLVATQGNPGSGVNTSLSMMTALGACTSLSSIPFIQINELTTVAAAYALAPFAQDYTHIGASGSNPSGLVNAFANAANLVNFASGQTPGSNLPAGGVEPVAELNTLANILAACVNTTGAASSQCTTLFSATAATETIAAALAIAKNPGSSAVTSLYSLSNGTAPFQPTLSAQPNDFTVAVNYTGNGMVSPFAIALDAGGNAWIANEGSTTVTELSPTGSLVTTATATNLYGPQGVAVDRSGNVWVANTAGNSVIKFGLTGGAITSTSIFTNGITAPSAIAMDSSGNAFVANFNANSVTKLSSAGTLIGSPFTAAGTITLPSSLALDTSGKVLVSSGNGTIVQLGNDGSTLATLTDSTLQGPLGIAVDPANRVFATGRTTGASVTGAVSEFSASGVASAVSPVQTGVGSPFGIASDGVSIWVANSMSGGSLAQLQYGTATPLSPAAGYGNLNVPIGIAIDASGSIWTANSAGNSVSKFVGLAQPVATPLALNVGP